MTRQISIHQLVKLFPDRDSLEINIWENGECLYKGVMSDCPEAYLHRKICEMGIREYNRLAIFY